MLNRESMCLVLLRCTATRVLLACRTLDPARQLNMPPPSADAERSASYSSCANYVYMRYKLYLLHVLSENNIAYLSLIANNSRETEVVEYEDPARDVAFYQQVLAYKHKFAPDNDDQSQTCAQCDLDLADYCRCKRMIGLAYPDFYNKLLRKTSDDKLAYELSVAKATQCHFSIDDATQPTLFVSLTSLSLERMDSCDMKLLKYRAEHCLDVSVMLIVRAQVYLTADLSNMTYALGEAAAKNSTFNLKSTSLTQLSPSDSNDRVGSITNVQVQLT